MLRLSNIKAEYNEDIISKVKKIVPSATEIKIAKRSVDARKKSNVHYVYSVDIETPNEKSLLKKFKNATVISKKEYEFPKGDKIKKPILIAGAGPAGLMCALVLSQNGYKVILAERGKSIEKRIKDVEKFRKSGILDVNSNVQFGEGGAGTFSDGKLTTGIKDFRIKKVLDEFYRHGAPEEILYDSKPHIGTDKLCEVVRSIRNEIIKNGSEVVFESCVTDIKIKDGAVCAVVINDDYEIETDRLVLAVGHSARDTFEMLLEKKVPMEQKAFSIGGRIEHSQEMIDKSMYGDFYDKFPHASYKLWTHTNKGRGVYTFCMCPGGEVIASASEEGGVVTNGMSNYDREGKNANSAVLVNVNPEDFGTDHVLGGMYLQRSIEQKAFAVAGSGYKAPAQSVGGFLGISGEDECKIEPTYKPGVRYCNIDDILPEYICEAMKEGIKSFDKKLKGFANPNAVITVPETRSSSPVRIIRNDECQSEICGLFPCGEGAGYAGGITSAAVDGIRVAEMVVKSHTHGYVEESLSCYVAEKNVEN